MHGRIGAQEDGARTGRVFGLAAGLAASGLRIGLGVALAGWLTVGLTVGLTGCGAPEPPPRNLVLISVDTLRHDALAVYDPESPPRPHLDALAERSRVFTHAHAPAPWTLPSQASLLTGLYPDRHGATELRQKLDPDVPHLASSLAAAGFETIAFTDGGYVHPWFGFGVGFARYDEMIYDESWPAHELPREGDTHPVHGADLFDRAVALLSQRKAEEAPLFLFLQTYGVHDYFKLHPWAVEEVSGAGAAEGRGPDGEPLRSEQDYLDCLLGKAVCSEGDWATLGALYAAEVANLDAGVGRLLAALEASPLADSTLVVLVSDHGEGFDVARHRIHHGGRVHEDLIRVPMLISGPGVVPGVSDAPVSLIDVAPTLLDLVGAPAPEGLDGESLKPLLGGGRPAGPRTLYAMEHFHHWDEGGRRDAREVQAKPISLAVIHRDLWYIQGPEGEQLYDMAADPRQTKNLVGDGVEALGPLRELAAGWESKRVFEPTAVDPVLEQQLRALGYLQ